jgi:hypothetical protein
LKPRTPFASVAQRTAWQAECRREAAKRMLRRLMRELSRVAREPVPPDQRRLAAEYRRARAAHVKALKRQREDVAISRHVTDGLQMDLALVN